MSNIHIEPKDEPASAGSAKEVKLCGLQAPRGEASGWPTAIFQWCLPANTTLNIHTVREYLAQKPRCAKTTPSARNIEC